MRTRTNILLPNTGLNTAKPAEYIESRNSPSMQNMAVNREIIYKRYGSVSMGTSLGEEVMYFKELLLNNLLRYMVRIGLTKVSVLTESTGTWDDVGPSSNSFVVTTSNNKLDFKIGAGELTATITAGTYVMGATQATAGSLCKAIYDAIHAAEATGTYTVTHSTTTGLTTITRSAGTFEILWKTGTNGSDGTDTHIGTLIGFSDSADDTGALTYTADTITYRLMTGTTADVFSVATPILSGERILVFSNFVDDIRKYTGTGNTADLGGSPPKAKFLQEYGPYLVLAHIDDGSAYKKRMQVQWCDTDDIETWTGGNSGSVNLLEDGNDITGMNIFGNYLCVHKETSIYLGYLVSTSSVFQFDRKNTGVGTICNNTIQNIGENSQIFLARDGIRVFNGISAELLQGTIVDELRETMNPEYIHKCWSAVVPELNEYWIGVPIGSQTGPDTVYKINYINWQAYKDYMPNIRAVGKYQRTTNFSWNDYTGTWESSTIRWDDISLLSLHQTVMYGDSSGVCTKRDSAYSNDNGTAIDGYIDTKDFTIADFGQGYTPGQLVRWLEMQIIAKGSNVTLKYSTDSGTTWTEVDEYSLGSDYPSDGDPVYAYFDTVSSKIRFRFQNDTAGETFSLKDFTLEASAREQRK